MTTRMKEISDELSFSELMGHLENTETMVCQFEYSWDNDFVSDIGNYNTEHEHQIVIIPLDDEGYSLEMKTDPILCKEELRKLIDLFRPYFLHSWSKTEFLFYLKEMNIINLYKKKLT